MKKTEKILGGVKIQEKFGKMILSGEKTKEFRKSSKGITDGLWGFMSLDEKTKFGIANGKEFDRYSTFNHNANGNQKVNDLLDNKDIDIFTRSFVNQNYAYEHPFVGYDITQPRIGNE